MPLTYKSRDELEAEIKELKQEIEKLSSRTCKSCMKHPDNNESKVFEYSCGECSQFFSDKFELVKKEAHADSFEREREA